MATDKSVARPCRQLQVAENNMISRSFREAKKILFPRSPICRSPVVPRYRAHHCLVNRTHVCNLIKDGGQEAPYRRSEAEGTHKDEDLIPLICKE